MARASPPPQQVPPALAALLEGAGDLALLVLRALREIARGQILLRETLRQMSQIGVGSLPISLLIMSFSGMVLALHTANQLKRLGLEGLIGGLVAVATAREAGPVLTAVAVAARVGSAIAAEIGTMVVTEQVDALRSLGVSPVRYLVVPRFVAAVLMLPVLTLFANVAAVLGGMFVSGYSADVSAPIYLNSVRGLLLPSDLFLGLVKTFVFGGIIAAVGCYQGLRTTGGAAGVGRSTTASVVLAIVLVYIADYFMAEWMFGGSTIQYR